jgi:hypothetical protein
MRYVFRTLEPSRCDWYATCYQPTLVRAKDTPETKELIMVAERKLILALYADRTTQEWIVLDREGQFWIVPVNEEDAWNQRRPFCPTDETELQPVPGHYIYMLGLPA